MINKRVFDLLKDFGASESPKSTRSSTTHWCPGRPGHPAFRHNIASSLRLHTGLPLATCRPSISTTAGRATFAKNKKSIVRIFQQRQRAFFQMLMRSSSMQPAQLAPHRHHLLLLQHRAQPLWFQSFCPNKRFYTLIVCVDKFHNGFLQLLDRGKDPTAQLSFCQ